MHGIPLSVCDFCKDQGNERRTLRRA